MTNNLLLWFFESTNNKPTLLLISFLKDKETLNIIQVNRLIHQHSHLFSINKPINIKQLITFNIPKLGMEIKETKLKVKTIYLESYKDIDLFMEYYNPLIRIHKFIQSLILSDVDGKKRITSLLEVLESNTNNSLTRIDLTNNTIGTKGIKVLSSILEKNSINLTSLNLFGNSINNKQMILLSEALKTNHTLTCLILKWNEFGKEGMIALSKVLEINCTLKSLN